MVYETGHFAFPLGEAIRENVAWRDRYFGPAGGTTPDLLRNSSQTIPPREAPAP